MSWEYTPEDWFERALEAHRLGIAVGIAEICPHCEKVMGNTAWGDPCECDEVFDPIEELLTIHELEAYGEYFKPNVLRGERAD